MVEKKISKSEKKKQDYNEIINANIDYFGYSKYFMSNWKDQS